MRKALLILLTMLLTLPSFASAYNYWYVTKAASPSYLAVNVTPPSGAGYNVLGSKTYITDAGITTADFTVVAPAGFSISAVKIDNVVATPVAADTYRVNKGTRTSHTIVAYYKVAQYLIDTTPATGGFISPDVQVGGGDVTVQIVPNAGSSIASVIVDGSAVDAATLAQVQTDQAYTFTNVSASHTLTATFAIVPKVTAVIGTPAQTQPVSATIDLDGTGSSSNVAATYAWSVDPAGPVITPADAASATFKASAPGDYAVTLTLSADGAADSTSTVNINIVSDIEYAFQSCATCHDDRNPGLVEDFLLGAHGAASGHTTGTCQRCHATEGAIAGMTAGWTGSYQTLVDSQATIWTPLTDAGLTSNNGISCYTCHDPEVGHFGALRTVNTNDGTNAVTWDPNQNGVTTDQYDLCTACHTLTDNTGAVVGNYHNGGSASYERTITDTHFDKTDTGLTGANTVLPAGNKVEGYVLRTTSANPCADCHNLHSASTEVQEAWAKSAHAGKIELKKEEAMCSDAVTFYAAAGATDCTTVLSGYSAKYNSTLPADENTKNAYELYAGGSSLFSMVDGSTVIEGDRTAVIATRENAGAMDDEDGNAWTHYNWEVTSRQGCQRCHTATGASNFLNDPASYNPANNDFSHLAGVNGTDGSAQQELLYCWGCHSDVSTGTLRNPGAITEEYDPAVIVTYPDVAESNVCMGCHLGRETGAVVAASTGDFSNLSFINSHYLAAGSTIFNESGYEFAGRSYEDGFHKNVGMGDIFGTGEAGPCVTCHMTSAEAHTFEVLDETGAPATSECVKCHTAGLDAAALADVKASFHDAMVALEEALAAKGIYFKPAHPYFYQADLTTAFKNWDGVDLDGDGLADNMGKDVMGAAFNYNLFEHDPGAYAHNNGYALKLIADSIDFLADGVIDGAGTFDIAGVQTDLLGNTAIYDRGTGDFTEASGVLALVSANEASTTCATCHTSTAAEWTDSRHANGNYEPANCTSSCHNPSNELVFDEVAGTVVSHVSCVGCHGPSSHPQSEFAAADSCVNCHNHTGGGHHGDRNQAVNVAASKHASADNHGATSTNPVCQHCHTMEGYIASPAAVGSYEEVEAGGAGVATATDIHAPTCAACHDPHTAELREVAGWDPNGNGVADQFDMCTACHGYYDQEGMIIGGGSTTGAYANTTATAGHHEDKWYRVIPSTHYDNPATGYGLATNMIEGYNIRGSEVGGNYCFDCHGHELRTNTNAASAPDPSDPEKAPTIFTEWAQSGHAGGLLKAKLAAAATDPSTLTYAGPELTDLVMNAGANSDEVVAHYGWKDANRQSCQMCHTATGFMNKMTAAATLSDADPLNDVVYDPANNDFSYLQDGQAEMLYCWGCHSSPEFGELRASGATTLDYTYAGNPVVIPSIGSSDTCVLCHAGRGSASELDVDGNISSSSHGAMHHAVATATLFSTTTHVGAEFEGLDYANVAYYKHNIIGTASDADTGNTTAGPCAMCHMNAAGAGQPDHTFDVVEKDESGVITGLKSEACYSCHSGAHGAALVTEDILDVDGVTVLHSAADAAAFLQEEAEGYKEAGEILEALLANTITNHAGAAIAANDADNNNRRAFQNAEFWANDAGGYAHNRVYSKRLIFDSIDWLEDGVINGAIADYSATYPEGAIWLGSARP